MKYFIPDKYTARLDAEQDFEGENKVDDTYQDEVYCIARKLADDYNYHTVLDVGTGGGFKLMKYFKDFATVAEAIGMRRDWFQPTSFPHYDLLRPRREAAVRLGAVELDRRGLALKIRELKSGLG